MIEEKKIEAGELAQAMAKIAAMSGSPALGSEAILAKTPFDK